MHFRRGDRWQLLIDVSTQHIGPISKLDPWIFEDRGDMLGRKVGNQLWT